MPARKLARALTKASAIASIAFNAIGIAVLLPPYLFPYFLAYTLKAAALLLYNKWRLRSSLRRYGMPSQLVDEALKYYEEVASRRLFPWLTVPGIARGPRIGYWRERASRWFLRDRAPSSTAMVGAASINAYIAMRPGSPSTGPARYKRAYTNEI